MTSSDGSSRADVIANATDMSVLMDDRAAGALAGLGSAAVIIAFFTVTGGPVGPGLLAIVGAAVAPDGRRSPGICCGRRSRP